MSSPQRLLVQFIVFIQPLLQRQRHGKLCLELLLKPRHVPLLFHTHGRNITVDSLHHDIPPNGGDGVGDIGLRQQVIALLVDDLALVIGDVIVLQQILANIKGIGNHAVLNGLALLHPQRLHKAFHPLGGEDPHQVVFHGQIEAGDTRVTLASRTTTQLVIDATGLVPLGAENV